MLFVISARAQPPDTLWMRTYDNFSMSMSATDAVATEDGGLMLAGTARDVFEQAYGFVIRLNAEGDSLWSRFLRTQMLDSILVPSRGLQTGGTSLPVC